MARSARSICPPDQVQQFRFAQVGKELGVEFLAGAVLVLNNETEVDSVQAFVLAVPLPPAHHTPFVVDHFASSDHGDTIPNRIGGGVNIRRMV
jgi:hypothetical protein